MSGRSHFVTCYRTPSWSHLSALGTLASSNSPGSSTGTFWTSSIAEWDYPTSLGETNDVFYRVVGDSGSSYPTAPAAAMLISINRFISTAYSIGSSLTIGSMNPATIIDVA